MLVWIALWSVTGAQAQVDESAEVIVRLRPPVAGDALRPIVDEQFFGLPSADVSRFDERLPETFRVALQSGDDAQSVADRLALRSDVLYAVVPRLLSLDGFGHTLSEQPPQVLDPVASDSSVHLPVIGAPRAWRVTSGDPKVTIGVVDTGVDVAHPALRNQLWVNPGEDVDGDGRFTDADRNGVDDDGNGFIDDVQGWDFVQRSLVLGDGDYSDPDADASEDSTRGPGRGHGTTVAGAAAGQLASGETFGVAPGVRIVPLRAFGSDGQGEDDDVARAILYAADLGVDVLNLSFGDVYQSPLVRDAVIYAYRAGVLIVASAGNRGIQAPHYPSDYPEVMSVVWLTNDGTSRAGLADFGPNIDLGAPASSIYVPVFAPEADAFEYRKLGGSSLAAPQVAGAAALLRSLDPSLSPASLRSILNNTARDLGDVGYDEQTGHGVLRVDEAVRRALPGKFEITSPLAEGGTNQDSIAIVGSVLDPAFRGYVVEVQRYESGEAWREIGRSETSVLNDTLAVWSASEEPDGVYLIRVRVDRLGSPPLERRVRFALDRSPPVLTVRFAGFAVRSGEQGVWVDVETSDDATVHLSASGGIVESDRVATAHGLFVPRTSVLAYSETVTLSAQNVAGLATDTTLSIRLPADRFQSALLTSTPTGLPTGHLLPTRNGRGLPDFNGNGLPDIALNVFQNEAIGDTLVIADLSGGEATQGVKLIANVLPRDWGDADGDGSLDLLTQISGATLLLGASGDGGYPIRALFQDTTGLRRDTSRAGRSAFLGAAIVDLDGDGRSELIGRSDTAWQITSFDGTAFRRGAKLDNPTPQGTSEISDNLMSDPRLAFGTFSGVFQAVSLDAEADLFSFAYDGSTLRPLWVEPQSDYAQRARMAVGDLDGDGDDDLISVRQTWTGPRAIDNEREPQSAYVSLHRDGRARTAQVALVGPLLANASALTTDLDGDGADEVLIAQEPFLYVFSHTPDGLALRWTLGDRPGDPRVLSPALSAHDFDGDGIDEVLVSTTDGILTLRTNPATSPPVVSTAYPLGVDRVQLAWRAVGADSVEVWTGEGDSIHRFASGGSVDTLVVSTAKAQTYRVRAIYRGVASAFSPPSIVIPRILAAMTEAERLDERQLRVRFTLPVNVEQATAVVDGSPATVQLLADARGVLLTFGSSVAAGSQVELTGVRDEGGAPLGTLVIAIPAAPQNLRTLIIARAESISDDQVRLTFSEPVDAASAQDPGAYTLAPSGRIAQAQVDLTDPSVVLLSLSDAPRAGIGFVVTITTVGVRAQSGALLAQEGAVVSIGAPAASLADAYVFPNPIRRNRDLEGLMIARLPARSEVTILSPTGAFVTRFEAVSSLGGVRWDLTDRNGERVPPGIYLVRIVSADGESRIVKAALL